MKVGTVVYKANILTPEVTERLNKAATLVTGYSCIRVFKFVDGLPSGLPVVFSPSTLCAEHSSGV